MLGNEINAFLKGENYQILSKGLLQTEWICLKVKLIDRKIS